MFFVSLNGLRLALQLADVTVWDRAPFPWHQPWIWLKALQRCPSTNTDAVAIALSLC